MACAAIVTACVLYMRKQVEEEQVKLQHRTMKRHNLIGHYVFATDTRPLNKTPSLSVLILPSFEEDTYNVEVAIAGRWGYAGTILMKGHDRVVDQTPLSCWTLKSPGIAPIELTHSSLQNSVTLTSGDESIVLNKLIPQTAQPQYIQGIYRVKPGYASNTEDDEVWRVETQLCISYNATARQISIVTAFDTLVDAVEWSFVQSSHDGTYRIPYTSSSSSSSGILVWNPYQFSIQKWQTSPNEQELETWMQMA